MSIEPRNEQQMLRQFWKKYPTYNLNALIRKRYEELMDARAFNEWLQNRQLKQQGEEYADAMGRMAKTVNRRIPQLRWAGAERRPANRPAGGRAVVSKASKSREPSASESALALRRCWTRGRQAPKTVSARQARQHLLPDKFPQSTEPLDENPRPHTQLGAQLQDDFVGFAASRPPPAAPSSSVSGRLGEAALRGGEAIMAACSSLECSSPCRTAAKTMRPWLSSEHSRGHRCGLAQPRGLGCPSG